MRFMVKVTMTHGTQFLDFFDWSMSLSVKNFLCMAQLSWWTENVLAKVRFFLQCFIDAV